MKRSHALSRLAIASRVSLVSLAFAVPAYAHIELDEPLVRHSNGDNGDNAAGEINKDGPCGLGGADDVRDEARATTLRAGSELTVKWRETIGHTGRMRIAFAAEGQLQETFDANVLEELPDPSGSSGNIGDGIKWESTITLPAEPCDTCTLQVIQAMNGNTTGDVGTPSPTSTYFQCADLKLVPEGVDIPPPPTDDTDGGTGCTSTSPSSTGTFAGALALLALLSRASRRTAR